MARVNNNNGRVPTSGSVSPNLGRDDHIGSSSSTPHRNIGSYSDIAKMVINSPAYQQAYELFSAESDKSWLQRLEMIPFSVQDANNTFLDNWGLSNKYEDKMDANYQYCIEQIQALVEEYQSWKNSLPVSQVQQLSDAGVNAGITGQGVSGSNIPNVGVSTDPSQLQSTSILDNVLQLGSFALNTATGLSSIVKSFKELGISKDLAKYQGGQTLMSQLLPFAKEMGIVVPSGADVDEVFDHIIESVHKQSYDADLVSLKRSVQLSKDTASIAPFISFLNEVGFDSPYIKDGKLTTGSYSNSPFELALADSLADIGELQFGLWIDSMEHQVNLESLKRNNALSMEKDGVPSEIDIIKLDKAEKDYEVKRLNMLYDFITKKKKSSDNGNWIDTIILLQCLGVDSPDISQTLAKVGTEGLSELIDVFDLKK